MFGTFLTSFRVTGAAVLEIFFLGLCGFFLLRKNIISGKGLDALSKLVVDVTLPLFVFTQLLLRFDFSLYPNWFIFPIISFVISLCGFIIGYGLIKLSKEKSFDQNAFLSLTTFQNSGYLVFPLVVALLPKDRADTILIYLFLFLLGFNLSVWSLGVQLLSSGNRKRFELGSLFTPVVAAILAGLLVTFLRIDRIIPDVVIRPFRLIGECTIPLAMLVVGGNLASIDFSKKRLDFSVLSRIVLAKLILLPALALIFIYAFKPAPLIGLLIIIEAAVPSATSLSIISRHYNGDATDFVGEGIFWTHLISIFTLPLFLSLFFVIS